MPRRHCKARPESPGCCRGRLRAAEKAAIAAGRIRPARHRRTSGAGIATGRGRAGGRGSAATNRRGDATRRSWWRCLDWPTADHRSSRPQPMRARASLAETARGSRLRPRSFGGLDLLERAVEARAADEQVDRCPKRRGTRRRCSRPPGVGNRERDELASRSRAAIQRPASTPRWRRCVGSKTTWPAPVAR